MHTLLCILFCSPFIVISMDSVGLYFSLCLAETGGNCILCFLDMYYKLSNTKLLVYLFIPVWLGAAILHGSLKWADAPSGNGMYLQVQCAYTCTVMCLTKCHWTFALNHFPSSLFLVLYHSPTLQLLVTALSIPSLHFCFHTYILSWAFFRAPGSIALE